MKIYLVTHAKREYGFNPSITGEGAQQIERVREDLLPKIPTPPLVVVGTGKRFSQTFGELFFGNPPTNVKHSPFCGSGDSMEADGDTIKMSCGDTTFADYIGLCGCAGFDAWKFLASLPENTLLCAGGELMEALGHKSEKGQLYELDTETKSCRQIT